MCSRFSESVSGTLAARVRIPSAGTTARPIGCVGNNSMPERANSIVSIRESSRRNCQITSHVSSASAPNHCELKLTVWQKNHKFSVLQRVQAAAAIVSSAYPSGAKRVAPNGHFVESFVYEVFSACRSIVRMRSRSCTVLLWRDRRRRASSRHQLTPGASWAIQDRHSSWQRRLERAAISRTHDGQILIDKSRRFQFQLGQWADSDSFLKA